METRRYFVGVATRDAVDAAIAGGYVEINHGKAGPLERMRDGDGIAYYSPRTAADGDALQAFTALGYVSGNALYQAGIDATGEAKNSRPVRDGASARPAGGDASARPNADDHASGRAGGDAKARQVDDDPKAQPVDDDPKAKPGDDDAKAPPAGKDANARPFRRAARYESAQPAPIRPMINSLSFIRSKSHWGAPLRFGFLQVSVADFACIAEAMGCDTRESMVCTTHEAVG